MSRQQSKPLCVVCGREEEHVVSFAGYALCVRCETELILTDPQDPEYDVFVERFKDVWRGLAEAAASRD